MKIMKKITTIIAIFILSLTSGFGISFEEEEPLLQPDEIIALMLMSELDLAFRECPDLVTEVAEKENIAINLEQARKESASISGKMSEWGINRLNDDGKYGSYWALLSLKQREQCLSWGINVLHHSDREQEPKCCSTVTLNQIESLLKAYSSYSPALVLQAQEGLWHLYFCKDWNPMPLGCSKSTLKKSLF